MGDIDDLIGECAFLCILVRGSHFLYIMEYGINVISNKIIMRYHYLSLRRSRICVEMVLRWEWFNYFLGQGRMTRLVLWFIRFCTFFQSSVDRIYPATFLHWGFVIYYFISQTFVCSFYRAYLTLWISLANLCYSSCMYYLTAFYDYLKAQSMIWINFYLIDLSY